ncbi:MAG: hypothetical protein WBB02_07050 [Saprospiraceae bacterium]
MKYNWAASNTVHKAIPHYIFRIPFKFTCGTAYAPGPSVGGDQLI